jgi:hypothetical protein
MMSEQKRGKDILLWVLTVALLIFTGLRNVHLIQTTLPPDWAIVGYVALAALDGGVLLWTNYFSNSAVGAQKTVAAMMVTVDFVGMVAGLLADTFLVGGGSTELVRMVALWVVPIVIGLNVLGKIACVMLDPSQDVRAAQAEADHAGMMSQASIYRALAQQRRQNAELTAAQVAPQMWANDEANLMAQFTAGKNRRVTLPQGEPVVINREAPGVVSAARVTVRTPARKMLERRLSRARNNLTADETEGPK